MDSIFWIVIAFLLVTLLLVIFAIWKSTRRGISKSDKAFVQERWKALVEASATSPSSSIVEADKLLDFTLGKLRYQGTLGDKLKAAGSLFSNLNDTWSAHKVRNRLAHEIGYVPSEGETKQVLKQFERALKDLKAL